MFKTRFLILILFLLGSITYHYYFGQSPCPIDYIPDVQNGTIIHDQINISDPNTYINNKTKNFLIDLVKNATQNCKSKIIY